MKKVRNASAVGGTFVEFSSFFRRIFAPLRLNLGNSCSKAQRYEKPAKNLARKTAKNNGHKKSKSRGMEKCQNKLLKRFRRGKEELVAGQCRAYATLDTNLSKYVRSRPS